MYEDQSLTRTWLVFGNAYRMLNRRDELARLVAWAEKKKLHGPLRAYTALLAETDWVVRGAERSVPRAVRLAKIVQRLSKLVRGNPRYYQGAASGYCRKSIDKKRKIHILKT